MRVDPVSDVHARAALEKLVASCPTSYAALSKMLGRNPAYLQQYVKRGSPRILGERDRKMLAHFFGIDEALLGSPVTKAAPDQLVRVPKLDVHPSAGAGAAVDDEDLIAAYSFDRRWLRDIGQVAPEQLSVVRVRGDSMMPTLADGDEILVSAQQGDVRAREGIYVLERDDTLIVKRLALNPSTGLLTISSDNPAYPSWTECPLDSIRVIGRVVWIGRRVN
jgi:phage repressor protein C with HTH and peptisase S24 domain